MKKIILLGLLAIGLSATAAEEAKPADPFFENLHPVVAPLPSGLLLKKGDRLAICGDSITEQRMYSRIMEDYLTMCTPQLQVTVRQFGWGGERANGFLNRMTNDVLRFQPTIATTCYGMNDHEYRPYEDSIGEAYRKYSTAIDEAFKAHDVRVVEGSSGCVGNRNWWQKGATTELLNENLCNLRNIGIEVATNAKVGFADVFWPMINAEFTASQKYGTNYALAGDAVHPGWAGHTIMAYAFLKALGLQGDIADFKLDLATGKFKVSTGHKLLSARNGAYEIRSERYPFCADAPQGLAANWYPTAGFYNVTNSDNLRSGMDFVPFNQELNRFMLTVSNTTAAKYRVDWGDQTREFTAERLNRGVNLAGEFTLNPFSGKFAMVDAAVSAKQEFETRQIKTIFRPGGKLDAPTDQVVALTDKMAADTERQHAALENYIHAAYSPVTYTLKVAAE
jgi:hypothetical protein